MGRSVTGGLACGLLAGVIGCSAGCSAGDAAQPPDITRLTGSMLVDQSSFPAVPGARWYGPRVVDRPAYGDYSVEPPQCSVLYLGARATQTVDGGLAIVGDAPTGLYSVTIAVPSERPDIAAAVSGCAHYRVGSADEAVAPRALPGLPDWATAFEQREDGQPGGVAVMGYYRGIFISVVGGSEQARTSDDQAALVKIVTDQVAKLDAG